MHGESRPAGEGTAITYLVASRPADPRDLLELQPSREHNRTGSQMKGGGTGVGPRGDSGVAPVGPERDHSGHSRPRRAHYG